MNINFELYKIFYTVAKNKSISKGAEELMISQPAVTQAIKNLESQLGGSLFHRSKKGVTLTSEGSTLFRYVKEGMQQFINGAKEFQSLKELNIGSIKIGSSTIIAETFLLPFLKQFHNQYPAIEIQIINSFPQDLTKQLREGYLDIIFVPSTQCIPKDIALTPIAELHDIFIANKEFYDKYDIIDFQNDLNIPIIIQSKLSDTRQNFEQFLKKHDWKVQPMMEVASHHLLKNLVINGMGIGLSTKEFIKNELKNKLLYEIKTADELPVRTIEYGTYKNITPSYALSKFIEMIRQ